MSWLDASGYEIVIFLVVMLVACVVGLAVPPSARVSPKLLGAGCLPPLLCAGLLNAPLLEDFIDRLVGPIFLVRARARDQRARNRRGAAPREPPTRAVAHPAVLFRHARERSRRTLLARARAAPGLARVDAVRVRAHDAVRVLRVLLQPGESAPQTRARGEPPREGRTHAALRGSRARRPRGSTAAVVEAATRAARAAAPPPRAAAFPRKNSPSCSRAHF